MPDCIQRVFLLYCDGFGEVAGLVGVAAAAGGDVVGEGVGRHGGRSHPSDCRRFVSATPHVPVWVMRTPPVGRPWIENSSSRPAAVALTPPRTLFLDAASLG